MEFLPEFCEFLIVVLCIIDKSVQIDIKKKCYLVSKFAFKRLEVIEKKYISRFHVTEFY